LFYHYLYILFYFSNNLQEEEYNIRIENGNYDINISNYNMRIGNGKTRNFIRNTRETNGGVLFD
jgi:hypothetical protein